MAKPFSYLYSILPAKGGLEESVYIFVCVEEKEKGVVMASTITSKRHRTLFLCFLL